AGVVAGARRAGGGSAAGWAMRGPSGVAERGEAGPVPPQDGRGSPFRECVSMSTSKRRRSLRCRPVSEALEGRQLLSTVIRGMDADGDIWTLRLVGPGAFQVQNQPGADGMTPVPIGQPGLIDTITVQGTNPSASRLIG